MGPDVGSSPASRSRPVGWQRLEGEAGPVRGTQPKRCWDREQYVSLRVTDFPPSSEEMRSPAWAEINYQANMLN